MAADKHQMDMCNGPIFKKIVLFAIPLMLSSAFQLIFHAVDLIVIGHFAPHEAMAAVGACGTLNVMLVNIFCGLATGASVYAGRYYGAKDYRNLSRTIHTGMTFAIFGGVIVMLLGLPLVKPLLTAMQTPAEILPKSCLYSWICYTSLPFQMIFNIGSGMLRAFGDTKRPLYFLTIAGVVNVLLNLFFVIICKMDVAGVALATLIAHGISAVLMIRAMQNNEKHLRFYWSMMHINSRIMKDMLKIGIPAAIQSSLFTISNLIIQSSINSFGSYAMAGSTTEAGVEAILHVCSV
jgi:putative MATE family efflux protein